jgi:hypothetical protein
MVAIVSTTTLLNHMIANIVTISTFCPHMQMFTEMQICINRRYRLTYRGAQTIIRKTHKFAFVTRIETAIYA